MRGWIARPRAFLLVRWRRPPWHTWLIDFSAPRDWPGSVGSWLFNQTMKEIYGPVLRLGLNLPSPTLDRRGDLH